MCRHIAVCAQQIGDFDRELFFMFAIAAEGVCQSRARIAIVAFDKLVFGMCQRRFDVLIGWAFARKTGF
jgi:hypothetical protein